MARTLLIDGPADGHVIEGQPDGPCISLVVPENCERVWWFSDAVEPHQAIGAKLVHYDYDGRTPAGTLLYVHEPEADMPAVVGTG